METSAQDRRGGAPDAEAAAPGSYGVAPADFRLPETTRLGPVHLQIGDLSRSLTFYEEVLGLAVLERSARHALLGTAALEGREGREARPLVELRERPGARPSPGRGRTGLFHFALLLPDRPALGRFLRHLADLGVRPGSADHLVSEALYLQDPDNLGIEVYRDRPRSEWRRRGRELRMATDPLDLVGVIEAGGTARWEGIAPGTVMGHVHLHVGDLDVATAFYSEAVGFDRTVWSYPGALFLAAGGYHHHLGTNLWAGRGASAPGAEEAQLLEWTVELPEVADVEAVRASLGRRGYDTEEAADANSISFSVTARDPWGTRMRLRAGVPG